MSCKIECFCEVFPPCLISGRSLSDIIECMYMLVIAIGKAINKRSVYSIGVCVPLTPLQYLPKEDMSSTYFVVFFSLH